MSPLNAEPASPLNAEPASPLSPESVLPHHGLAAHEVVLLLETDLHDGLSQQAVTERLPRFGPNALSSPRGPGVLLRLLWQLHHPLIYVLIAAAAITVWLGEYVDSVVILGVVVVNAVVGFIQESRAEAALEGLRSMVRTPAKVIRGGQEQSVGSEELVPGDLVVLEAGDRVPADVRLTGLVELRIDESALTGESVRGHLWGETLSHASSVVGGVRRSESGVGRGTGAGLGVGGQGGPSGPG